jgi:hypothetical protein
MDTNRRWGWWGIELPGYRASEGTYMLYPYEGLPPIQEGLDEKFGWLEAYPEWQASIAAYAYNQKRRASVKRLEKQAGVALPADFRTFMASKALQRRVRSCTDCYVELADRPVRTAGDQPGYLIHFLSDSQWVLHWFLFVGDDGQTAVICSPYPYGLMGDETDEELKELYQRDDIDLMEQPTWFCADSFSEFIYRFWLENEIWFAAEFGEEGLSAEQQAYVDHYGRLTES